MPQLLDIKAFLATARAGSFSAAARELEVAASVVTKRVNRLEEHIGAVLFSRTTRRLTLTGVGERLRPRLQVLVAEIDDALRASRGAGTIVGHLRVKSPTTVGALFVGEALVRFQARNPDVTSELLLIDRAVNPIEENFDVALGALPDSFPSVLDVPLCRYDRVLVASPRYLARGRVPRTPNDLVEHDCLAFLPAGVEWAFDSPEGGTVAVAIHARFTVNDSRILLGAAIEGLGLAVVPRFLARPALEAGTLVTLLHGYPLKPLWFKAMVPRSKAHKPEVGALIEHLKQEFGPVPPWERPTTDH
jgi:DNA-binding transcriptional LysR family regulator